MRQKRRMGKYRRHRLDSGRRKEREENLRIIYDLCIINNMSTYSSSSDRNVNRHRIFCSSSCLLSVSVRRLKRPAAPRLAEHIVFTWTLSLIYLPGCPSTLVPFPHIQSSKTVQADHDPATAALFQLTTSRSIVARVNRTRPDVPLLGKSYSLSF